MNLFLGLVGNLEIGGKGAECLKRVIWLSGELGKNLSYERHINNGLLVASHAAQ